jgi:Fic family protein
MKPPYSLTPSILQLVSSISEKIGEINASHLHRPKAELRKSNRIKTIQSSLQIEGNSLSLEQVTALFENKRVLGPPKDILEVKNAIEVYNELEKFKPYNMASFLKAHRILMKGLIPGAGSFRSRPSGILKGSHIEHVAPPGKLVKSLINGLFTYLKKDKDLLLIKSCVFHYELEFIHPFSDGNGRMGRLWQTVILMQEYPVFEFLPIETIIKNRQREYYRALSQADKAGNSTSFIEFMLQVLEDSLKELLNKHPGSLTEADRISLFKSVIGSHSFSRKDYLRHFKHISPATASRDLKVVVKNGILTKQGEKRMTVYKFK